MTPFIDLIVDINHNVLWDRKGSNSAAHCAKTIAEVIWGVIVLLPFRSHHALR